MDLSLSALMSLRGVPSGLLGSVSIRPLKPATFAIAWASSRMLSLPPSRFASCALRKLGNDVAALQVEIVAGSVKVGEHSRNVVAPISPVVGLAQLDAGHEITFMAHEFFARLSAFAR